MESSIPSECECVAYYLCNVQLFISSSFTHNLWVILILCLYCIVLTNFMSVCQDTKD